jgi:hypothetical protein
MNDEELLMTNEISEDMKPSLCRIAGLEHEKRKNNYALGVLPYSSTFAMHSPQPKSHPS